MRLPSLIALGVLAASLPNATVHAEPAKEPRTVLFGDLELTYDSALWSVSESDGRLVIECVDRGCREISVYGTMVDDPVGDNCNANALSARLNWTDLVDGLPEEATVWRATPGGLAFHFIELYIGCRNLAGGPVAACTHHAGRTYFFDAPGEHCHTPWGIGAAVEGILAGVTPK